MFRKINCPECDGYGYYVIPIHVCGGDSKICLSRCPEARQECCMTCGGNGVVELDEDEKKD